MGIFDLASDWNIIPSDAYHQDGFLQHVMRLINSSSPGGIAGLVQKFHDNGLSDMVSSWIGEGQNQPVSEDQINEVIGDEQVQQLANAACISHEEAAMKLAQVLPQVIDELTSGGDLPGGHRAGAQ